MISNAHRMWANGHFYLKLQILFFVKLWATGPKFNYGCGGPVSRDMLQWATWPYRVVCCGPLGQGEGWDGLLCLHTAYTHTGICSWSCSEVMVAGGYTVLVMSVFLELTCNARTTHRYNTTHCMGCMLCELHDAYTTRGVTCFVQWPFSGG